MPRSHLPYVDQINDRLAGGDDGTLAEAFRSHLHWGCYEDPDSADDSLESYVAAAGNLARRVCAAAGTADDQRILDVGCGAGGTLAGVDRASRGCRLVGIDVDPRQLARARAVVTGHEDNSVAFVVADGCVLPLAAGPFDVVLAVECVFHFESRKRFLREASRVLRSGGRLALSDFVLVPGALQEYAEWAAARPESPFYGRNSIPVTPPAYERLARGCGLDVVDDEDVTPNTLPTYPAMRRIYADAGLDDGELATDYLETVARQGWVQYHVLSFAKPPG